MAEAGPRRRMLIEADSRPALPRFVRLRHDAVRGRWVLLAPERVLAPDGIALEVLRLCDGRRTVAEAAERLAEDYDAPPEAIAADIVALLQDLADKGYIRA